MNEKQYRWPDLSPVVRQYVVQDDQGRYGIATQDDRKDVLFARPIGVTPTISAENVPGAEDLPANAILMTATAWTRQDDGAYTGTWYDYDRIGRIPPEDLRRLTIVDDLGIRMPDRWADEALAGSEMSGYWDYGATLGKIGGEPPVKGQSGDEMTVGQAEEYAKEVGEKAAARGIRLAAKNGYIPGSRKVGRDWLIPYEGFNHYLDNRPKPGRK